ncbi:MAG: cyclic nucleotide-binding/CBS domain-containing protein [Kiritimatiellia bacterium]
MENLKVRQVIESKGSGKLFTIKEDCTLREMVRIACEMKIGALLVSDDDDNLLGIISERDILRQVNAKVDFDKVTVGDIMTRNLLTVDPEEGIQEAMDIMIKKRIRHLPVIHKGKIEGLITVRDILHAMRDADAREAELLVNYLQHEVEDREQP